MDKHRLPLPEMSDDKHRHKQVSNQQQPQIHSAPWWPYDDSSIFI